MLKQAGTAIGNLIDSLVARWRESAAKPTGGSSDSTNFTLLIEEQEPIDVWTICTVCLNVDRTATVARKRWRCADCGVDAKSNLQQPLRDYLNENSLETIENNLRQWGNAKGVRAAYKMLRSARYKCLMTLGKRLQSSH